MAGWKWDGKESTYNSRTVFDYINGAAELYLAYGFQRLKVRRFAKPGSPRSIWKSRMASRRMPTGFFLEYQDNPAGIAQGSEFEEACLVSGRRNICQCLCRRGGEGVEGNLGIGRAAAQAIPATGWSLN
jgi:hypothetical protein